MGEPLEVTDADELAHAATIRMRLQQSLILLTRFDLASDSYAPMGSALAGDDAVTAPFHTSHTVVAALPMATENIRALHRLLLVDKQLMVPMYAHYPVMRSILEAASLERWILSPDDRNERVLRSLRARGEDITQDHALRKNEIETLRTMDVIGNDPDLWHRRIDDSEASNAHQYATDLQTLRDLTHRQALTRKVVKDGLPPWIHLIKDVSTIDPSDA